MGIPTERWSDKKFVQNLEGKWEYQRGFDVAYPANETDAVTSTGITVGQPHPQNGNIVCSQLFIAEYKWSLARVIAKYSVSSLVSSNSNPLDQPVKVRWRREHKSLPVDTDSFGNAILNSPGDAFAQKITRNFTVRHLHIERYEPYYDQDEATFFGDTTNDGTITFQGNEFDAGQVYCHDIAPMEEYEVGAPFVKIGYDFEIRTPNTPNLTDLQIRYPFQPRLLDQGTRALYDAGGGLLTLGQLYLADGHPVEHPVLFNGYGIPLDDSIVVTQGGLEPQENDPPDGVLVDPETPEDGKPAWLIYLLYGEVDFTGITD